MKQTGKTTGTFYFKRFKVEDGNSTMRVGTDAVLLGASVEVSGVGNILEIGTGCGVIALMLAQRSQALIDAIDIDEASVVQAGRNVRNSPWNDRIRVIHNSLQDYTHKANQQYDLIVCNPPYFSRSLKSPVKTRNIARHHDTLSFTELLEGSAKLMTDTGSLWVILPIMEYKEFIETAALKGFFLQYKMMITSLENKEYQRIILQLKTIPAEDIREKFLAIKTADQSFSKEYIELTGEFYLDF